MINAVLAFKGKQVRVYSSLDRRRGSGVAHNRHHSTALGFNLDNIRAVGVTISGSQLVILGTESGYAVGLSNVTSFTLEPDGTVEIIEQFELKTERLTRLTLIEPENGS